MPGKAKSPPELPAPVPKRPGMPGEAADERASFAKLTAATPRDAEAEEAFLASKAHIAGTHPRLDRGERELALAELRERLGGRRLAALAKSPVRPGGVGYGLFYNKAFKRAFALGTSMQFEIVCPNPPGGNVDTWLYLTGMNRAARGIEAFVSYFGQSEPHFKVFDWARKDQWQVDVPFENLADYVGPLSAHGTAYQTLAVWNSTVRISPGRWRNEAWLRNRAAARWDLVYRYDYAATRTQQQGGWIGSWAPIVETFQTSYTNTRRFGALGTRLIGRAANGSWGSWRLLSSAHGYVRSDNKGFHLVFLDRDYAFVVDS